MTCHIFYSEKRHLLACGVSRLYYERKSRRRLIKTKDLFIDSFPELTTARMRDNTENCGFICSEPMDRTFQYPPLTLNIYDVVA